MKTKITALLAVCMLLALTACEDKLDTSDYTHSNTANFPASLTDAQMLVTAMYANLNHASGNPASSHWMLSAMASDDLLGGNAGSLDKLLIDNDNQFDEAWSRHYKGVFLANTAIEGISKFIEDTGDETVCQMLGEAYFMRAFYYFELAEMFGEVPLRTSTTQESNLPKAPAEETYALIASDLVKAVDLMSKKPYNAFVKGGHATRWAAEALLARVFLFYTGFYEKETLPAQGGETPVTKAAVTEYINDCVQNSGHDLVADFRNLWPYTNPYTVNDYAYTAGKNGIDGKPLQWAGNNNCEEVFSVKYCNYCGYEYDGQQGYNNVFVPYFGFPGSNDAEQTFPFGNGNGWATVARNLWDDWKADEPGDLRREASIMDTEKEYAEQGLTPTPNKITGQWEDCGLRDKKMMPVLAKGAMATQGSWANAIYWACDPNFDKANNYGMTQWGGHFQDLMLIRFSDVLLMQSELTGDATGMNRVRARVGLAPVGYSLEALQKERRHELAMEPTRWTDIRRWHIAPEAMERQNGCKMNNGGAETTLRTAPYSERYAATKGFFQIPPYQILLSNGVLKQNDGWEVSESRPGGRWFYD